MAMSRLQQRSPSDNRDQPLHVLLEVRRVHGASWLHAAVPMAAPAMPPATWAWVTATRQLMFGRLDRRQLLRWTTAFIGATTRPWLGFLLL
jgi:hypothetical protein